MYTTDDTEKTKRILFGLQATRNKIAIGWSRGFTAETSGGLGCSPHSPNAARWSLPGAIHCVADDKIYLVEEMGQVLRGVLRQHTGWNSSLFQWNERKTTTKDDVLELLDMAILDQKITLNVGDTILEALLKTRRLIQRGWAHGSHFETRALDAEGKSTAATRDKAVAWSLVGAVDRATCGRGNSILFVKTNAKLSDVLQRCFLNKDLTKWNDHRDTTKENVIWLLNEAIKDCSCELVGWTDTCREKASPPVLRPTYDDIANNARMVEKQATLCGRTRVQWGESMVPNSAHNLLIMMRDYIENNTLDDTHPLTNLLTREADQSLTGFMHLVSGGHFLEWRIQDAVWHRVFRCNGQVAIQRVFHQPRMRIIRDLKVLVDRSLDIDSHYMSP